MTADGPSEARQILDASLAADKARPVADWRAHIAFYERLTTLDDYALASLERAFIALEPMAAKALEVLLQIGIEAAVGMIQSKIASRR